MAKLDFFTVKLNIAYVAIMRIYNLNSYLTII